MENIVLKTSGLKFRWINGQGFEFVMPNGKTLLTDPFYDMPSFEEGKGMALTGFHTEDIDHVDYVFINHTHGDHIGNLQEIVAFNSSQELFSVLQLNFIDLKRAV